MSNHTHSLTQEQVSRYSRHLLLPCIGTAGQERIIAARVLVVGAGGLGCPVMQYLAAAGVGTIGIVDYDVLEMSNLQRQVIHSEANVGKSKTESAKMFINALNSQINVETFQVLLDKSNAMEIVEKFDIVVDATDNVATRYLLNDVSVFAGKPLVSAGAIRLSGQITVYNYDGGPCYRCIFPVPPPPETVTNCNDGGVLGVITGIIGSIQALEVLKLIIGLDSSLSQKLMIVDGLDSQFRTVKLRKKRDDCPVCGTSPTITEPIDYVQFCGSGANDNVVPLKMLDPEERISVKEYAERMKEPHILIDVRPKIGYDICGLKGSINIPLKELAENIDKVKSMANNLAKDGSLPNSIIF